MLNPRLFFLEDGVGTEVEMGGGNAIRQRA